SPPWLTKLGVNSRYDLTPRIIPRGLFFVQVPENPSNRNAPFYFMMVDDENVRLVFSFVNV
ncbi:hypothetical protein M3568_19660, partial [Priestia flexa]|uniref:hypothetical protein n=1 Tax=Priestia flexa TaxID=86664 RepID=UPI00203DD5FA